MQCVQVNAGGWLELVSPQPVDTSACTAILLSASEVPWYSAPLDADQGAAIGAAILGVWALAWGFRTLAEFITSIGEENANS